MTMMDLGSVKKDFSALISQIQPWTLSHFVMWLDIKVAEYKVFGRMIMDNTPNDTPQWLRVSAEYMLEQQKEAMKNAAAAAEVSLSPPVAPVQSPPATQPSVLQKALMNPTFEPITSFATSASSLYTVSTVNSTVVSPSVSPAYSTVSQVRTHSQVDTYKQTPTVENAEIYAKASPLSQFTAYTGRETGRIPPISHLSPKHIRQSHLEHNMSMSLPVSLTPVSINKDISKENLSAAEVETQIAVLQSQIAAVNRNLQASQTAQPTQEEVPVPVPVPHPTPRGRRKAASTDDASAAYIPPPYPKKTRQQSPVGNRVSTESALPPLHSSMDIMSRLHRLDTESIPESLRSQNIQSTLEAFEALRTQTFPPNPDVLRTQIASEIENIQNTAQDMSIHHVTAEREQQVYPVTTEEYTAVTTEREHVYPTALISSERDQTSYQAPSSSVLVKVEQEISDNDSEASQLRTMPAVEEVVTTEDHTGAIAVTTVAADDNQNYTAMYASPANTPANTDEKLAADISTKKMRRKFLESMKNSNPKYYSHQIQQIIPFPDKFPVASLDYGLKALQMIQTGEITRAGKIQLIDTIFHELIKYTGLYPTPTQKMAVANSIVETFPTLAAKMKASHISPADSWYVILCDKFRNERRGLGGSGSSPRVGKTAKMVKEDPPTSSTPAVITEPTEEATVEIQTSRETPPIPGTPQHEVMDESSQPPPGYAESPQAYQQAYQQPPQLEKEIVVPESSSDMEEEEAVDKLLMNADDKQQYADRGKRSFRRKTQSPKRHVHPDIPILDERYAASLLEYYSKHKPYYPGEADGTRQMELEIATTKSDTALDEKSLGSSQELVSGRSSVSGHYNGQETEAATEDEVAAIVQSVVSAHMDEVLAARQYKQQLHADTGEVYESPKPELSPEPKLAKKQKPKIIQKEKTPEQQQLNQQRFVQKVALTYPGVTVIDESTLLCRCGVKVKLGRARMLHNYTNYHLKRCQNPPIPLQNVKTELAATPPLHLSGALLAQYAAELGADISGMPLTGHKSQLKDRESPRESSSFTEPPEKEKVQVIKNYPLNIPVPSSEMLLHGLAATAALGMTMTVPSGDASATQSLDLTLPSSEAGITTSAAQSLDLSAPVSGLSESMSQTLDSSAHSETQVVSTESESVESEAASTVADLRMTIPGNVTVSTVSEYSELPELTAMNALSIIQGKADGADATGEPVAETMETTTESDEPINLADS